MQLLRLLRNTGIIITKISWPLYTPQFKTFSITENNKHNRLEKKNCPTKGSKILPGLLCKHNVSGKTMRDQTWTI